MKWFPKCPDGHRWWKCRHEELAHPVIGKCLMSVGAFEFVVGVLMIVKG